VYEFECDDLIRIFLDSPIDLPEFAIANRLNVAEILHRPGFLPLLSLHRGLLNLHQLLSIEAGLIRVIIDKLIVL
jgi:hypothetical protein